MERGRGRRVSGHRGTSVPTMFLPRVKDLQGLRGERCSLSGRWWPLKTQTPLLSSFLPLTFSECASVGRQTDGQLRQIFPATGWFHLINRWGLSLIGVPDTACLDDSSLVLSSLVHSETSDMLLFLFLDRAHTWWLASRSPALFYVNGFGKCCILGSRALFKHPKLNQFTKGISLQTYSMRFSLWLCHYPTLSVSISFKRSGWERTLCGITHAALRALYFC